MIPFAHQGGTGTGADARGLISRNGTPERASAVGLSTPRRAVAPSAIRLQGKEE
ncbi:MAG: hypothetical protein JSR56_10255 [Proteobacteria bacterium]|nr:hypothetical protein [Pseudomonadota bacterium]